MSLPSTYVPATSHKQVMFVLHHVAKPGMQAMIAERMGVSESTVSRIKTTHVEDVVRYLCAGELKVVHASDVTIKREAYDFMRRIVSTALAQDDLSQVLFEEDE